MLFQQLSTYLLEILIRIIVGTCFLWTDIYTKKYLRITVIRPIGVTPTIIKGVQVLEKLEHLKEIFYRKKAPKDRKFTPCS